MFNPSHNIPTKLIITNQDGSVTEVEVYMKNWEIQEVQSMTHHVDNYMVNQSHMGTVDINLYGSVVSVSESNNEYRTNIEDSKNYLNGHRVLDL
jgi:hypothetical protein